jgi:phage protein D
MPTEILYGSEAPVFKVDGEVKGQLARDLTHLDIEEATDGLKSLRARFANWGAREGQPDESFLYLDGATLDFGKAIEVSMGLQSDPRIVFSGVISAIEVALDEGMEPQIVVHAEDRLMDLRMTRRSRTYERQSDADIASAIASEHGLSPDTDAPGPTYDVVQQWNQSDLAFLRDRARLIQAEVWIEDDRLCFKARGSRTSTDLTLVQGNDLLSVQIRADLAHQRTKVHVSGYDAQARDVIDEQAGADAIAAEATAGRTGIAVLERAIGERVSRRVREAPLTSEEAREWAKAEMLRRARGFVHVSAVARGQADMIVGSHVALERVGPPFEGGGYYVTRVCHTYRPAAPGFRTHFEAERATIND